MRNFTDSRRFYGGVATDLLARGIRKIAVIRAEEEWAQGVLRKFIISSEGFKGLLGVTKFDAKGDAIHPGIPMYYQDGVCRELERADVES